ncbi:MAG: metalloregulator ArsR/SmtB family transcription factor [Erysipelothrix sp.]
MKSELDELTIDRISRVFQTISYPTRIQILYLLREKPLPVSEVAASLDMEQSTVSHQLRILKDDDLVRSTRQGKSIIYAIADEHVFSIFDMAIEHVMEGEK